MLILVLQTLLLILRSRQALVAENLALRHQIEVLQRNSTKPALKWRDRAFWDVLSCLWPRWRDALTIVRPETVLRWHRRGFRYYWRWRNGPKWPGSPWENGYIESFNGEFRDELLTGEIFYTLQEARVLTEQNRKQYNRMRPHSSLGYRPPAPEAVPGPPISIAS